VIVHDLDLRRAIRCPNEAHPELVIDPDRVLSLSLARQSLKPITRRRFQIAEIGGRIEVAQFAPRYFDQISREAFRAFPLKTASVVLSRKLLITADRII